MTVTPDVLRTAVRREGEALRVAALRDLTRPVPTCGHWDSARLLGHVGTVHRMVLGIVDTRRTEPPDTPPERPGPETDLSAWYAEGLDRLGVALAGLDPDEPVWNWSPLPDTGAFWLRRMAHEHVVHRFDAQAAQDGPDAADDIPGPLAGDGIEELFEAMLARLFASGAIEGLTGSLHLHATDIEDGEWLAALSSTEAALTREHAKADVAVRGPAGDLLLLAYNRLTVDAPRLEVLGDRSRLAAWRAAVKI